jgi:hypothetical protein
MKNSAPQSIRAYRLYFLDHGNHIAKAHDVECASDAEAGELAALMLSEQSTFPAIEVGIARGSSVATRSEEEEGGAKAALSPDSTASPAAARTQHQGDVGPTPASSPAGTSGRVATSRG